MINKIFENIELRSFIHSKIIENIKIYNKFINFNIKNQIKILKEILIILNLIQTVNQSGYICPHIPLFTDRGYVPGRETVVSVRVFIGFVD